jgi:predicted nucleotidyltransferase component of viral defense system
MRLHLNKQLFANYIRVTAQQMKIPAIYVEKDYWVTYTLFTIFNNEIGKETVFKGGTALSKCYNMIERFSEDVDLVVLRREGETDSKLKSKLKAISTVVNCIARSTHRRYYPKNGNEPKNSARLQQRI